LIEIDGLPKGLPNLKIGGSFHGWPCECHNQLGFSFWDVTSHPGRPGQFWWLVVRGRLKAPAKETDVETDFWIDFLENVGEMLGKCWGNVDGCG